MADNNASGAAPPNAPASSASTPPAVPTLRTVPSATSGSSAAGGSSAQHPPPISTAPHRATLAESMRSPVPPSPNRSHPRHQSLSLSSSASAAVQELVNRPPTAGTAPRGRTGGADAGADGSGAATSKFAGRDWREISVRELLVPSGEEAGRGSADLPALWWADMDTTVEEATRLLLKNTATNVVLIRGDENSSGVPSAGGKWATSTFDYADLTRYLLVVVGLATPESPEEVALYDRLAAKARDRQPITIREIQPLCRQESLVALPFDESVGTAMEILGSGVHRVLVTSPLGEVVGLLSQARLVEFFWNEGGAFEGVEPLWPMILRDLDVGSKEIMAVRDDKPLADALTFMARESLTSVAVVDSGNNVVGNISTTDVRLLTSSASLPLLQMSCMHFVSVALSERGVEKGRDPFPVFHVYPTSTLAHTVAKLVATRAHRVWVVENSQNHSPGPSVPGTPKLAPAASPSASSTHLAVSSPTPVASLSAATSHTSLLSTLVNPPTSPPQSPLPPATVALAPPSTASMPVPVRAPSPTPPALSHQTGPQSPGLPSIPSSASAAPSTPPIAPGTSALSTSVLTSDLPGARLSGRLLGVVSLTDALNLFARSAGLRPANPGEMRARRRRSSSMSVRPSLEGLLGGRSERSSFDGSAVPSTQPRR